MAIENGVSGENKFLEPEAYFATTGNTRDFFGAKNLFITHIKTGKLQSDFYDNEATITALRQYIEPKLARLYPKCSTDGIIEELKKAKLIKPEVFIVVTEKFIRDHIELRKLDFKLIDTPDSIERLENYLIKLGATFLLDVSPYEVIEELKKRGLIKEPPIDKKAAHIQTEYVHLDGPTHITLEEEKAEILEANLLHDEIERRNIFKNKDELNIVYEKALNLENNPVFDEAYYIAFLESNLLKNGNEELQKDLLLLKEVKEIFRKKSEENLLHNPKVETAKKVATITEKAVAYGISELSWFGKDVKYQGTSEFNDYIKGIDGVLEIGKAHDELDFVALGVDVTYRGLESDEFKQKFFKLLKAISNNKITTAKYHTNHKGEQMKEFSIPKIILHFNIDDVRDLIDMVKNTDNADLIEKYKISDQRLKVFSQIISSCEVMASFAYESENEIFRKYYAAVNSFKVLTWKNESLRKLLEQQSNDEMIKKLKELIEEFKLIKEQEKQQNA